MKDSSPPPVDDTSPPPREQASHTTTDKAENYWDYCPNCGTRLHNAGCKYRCSSCHYFMSCSDFD